MQKSPFFARVVLTEQFLTIFFTVLCVLEDFGRWEFDLLLIFFCKSTFLLSKFMLVLLVPALFVFFIVLRDSFTYLGFDLFCIFFGLTFFITLNV